MNSTTTSSNRQDYLKAILALELRSSKASTSAISDKLKTQPASVTGMLRKLAENDLIEYIPYQGAKLTETGRDEAISIFRKHRLWETFMVEKLGFGWDEVHAVAEQLEHVDSIKLISRLDAFLGYPKFDALHTSYLHNSVGSL